jgi:hypothetical protein
MAVIGRIIKLTTGTVKWAKISMDDFAFHAMCTEGGAAKAVEKAEKLNLIESRRAGKGRE